MSCRFHVIDKYGGDPDSPVKLIAVRRQLHVGYASLETTGSFITANGTDGSVTTFRELAKIHDDGNTPDEWIARWWPHLQTLFARLRGIASRDLCGGVEWPHEDTDPRFLDLLEGYCNRIADNGGSDTDAVIAYIVWFSLSSKNPPVVWSEWAHDFLSNDNGLLEKSAKLLLEKERFTLWPYYVSDTFSYAARDTAGVPGIDNEDVRARFLDVIHNEDIEDLRTLGDFLDSADSLHNNHCTELQDYLEWWAQETVRCNAYPYRFLHILAPGPGEHTLSDTKFGEVLTSAVLNEYRDLRFLAYNANNEDTREALISVRWLENRGGNGRALAVALVYLAVKGWADRVPKAVAAIGDIADWALEDETGRRTCQVIAALVSPEFGEWDSDELPFVNWIEIVAPVLEERCNKKFSLLPKD